MIKATLAKKRAEYWKLVDRYFKLSTEDSHKDTYHQIKIDIPRTNPSIGLYQQAQIQVYLVVLWNWFNFGKLKGINGTRTIYLGHSPPGVWLCSRIEWFNLPVYDGLLLGACQVNHITLMLFYHRWLDMGKSSKILTSRRSHSKQSNRLILGLK